MPPDIVVLPNEDGAFGVSLVAANQQEDGSRVAEEALEQVEIALIEV